VLGAAAWTPRNDQNRKALGYPAGRLRAS